MSPTTSRPEPVEGSSGSVTGSGGSWVRACAVAELARDTAMAVEVDGTEIALVRSGDDYHALADQCSHAAIPLSDGEVVDGTIECYLHSSLFDLATGKPLGLPATEPVAVYPVRVEGDDLLVDVTSPTN